MSNDIEHCVVEFTFGKSTSQAYRQAVDIAKSFRSYLNRGTEQRPIHSIKVELSSSADAAVLDTLMSLVCIAQNWKTASLSINGYKSQNFYELHTEFRAVIQCENTRKSHPLSDDYCRGMKLPSDPLAVFGCRFATGVRRSTDRTNAIGYQEPGHLAAASNAWWRYTTETADRNVFKVQKDVIRLTLVESTKMHACRSCKYYSTERLENDIASLPDTLDVGSSGEFSSLEYSDLGVVKRRVERKLANEPLWQSLVGERQNVATEVASVRRVPALSLQDVAINDKTLDRVRDTLVLPIKHPEYFKAMGASVSRGVLLYGPPGNGKTLLAEAIAGEVGAHFVRIDGPEILSKWVGESENNLRNAFQEAVKMAPSVLFIDEIDSIAPVRSSGMQQHNNQLVAQLLTLLNDVSQSVWVFASTNRIEAVDSAVLRPGRFDHHVYVDRPDAKSLCKILSINIE